MDDELKEIPIVIKHFRRIPLNKMSAVLWDALVKYHETMLYDGKETIMFHGIKAERGKDDIIRIYEMLGDHYTQIKNNYLIYLMYKAISEMENPATAIIPAKDWKRKHIIK